MKIIKKINKEINSVDYFNDILDKLDYITILLPKLHGRMVCDFQRRLGMIYAKTEKKCCSGHPTLEQHSFDNFKDGVVVSREYPKLLPSEYYSQYIENLSDKKKKAFIKLK